MARRIEIELTSARPDGSWTWRAAGAREPRGVLEGGLLPGGAKAGDVLRAEADFEIDGITIVSVHPPKPTSRPEPQRIEIIGSGRTEVPAVTTQLVGRSDRRPGDRRRDRDEGRPRREREGARPNGRDGTRPRREGPPADGERAPGPRDRPDHPERVARPERRTRSEGDDRTPRPERRGSAERRERPAGPRRDGEGDTRGRPTGPGRRDRSAQPAPGRDTTPSVAPERRARRLTPGRTHRQAILASLPPEQQPVAEQVLRGGIPAVRTALHLEREKAMAEGRPVPNTDQLVAMAESLLPRLKAAEWRDRAEAAARDVDDISLRDLRSVVAGADVARDEETRALAARLREALDRRVEAMRTQWADEIARLLDDNKIVRALRQAARPPEPAARLDSALSERLSEAAGQALAPDAPAERWLAVLDAVAASPVRRSVKPAGLPGDPTPEVRRAAHQQSGRIPALAAMLGVSMPPPPVAVPTRRPPARRRSRGGSGGGSGREETPASSDGGAGTAPEPAGDQPEATPATTGQPQATLAPAGAPPASTPGPAGGQPDATAAEPDATPATASDQPGATPGPAGGQPDATAAAEPEATPATAGDQPGATPGPVGAQPEATPATAGDQPGATPGPVGAQPDATPATAGDQPGATPGPEGAQPDATPATAGDQPTTAPAGAGSAEGVENAVVVEELGESVDEG